ncbi:YARHG domain-containing protein [Clostridium sp. JS66]|uniref:YARHG domain-containing protein n=1 Tax=Clostridium sp. JS66 TaxID=3064705 RepID=UPI00298EB6CB|nr:YARHG domain-containing protein [Clostridium sp. JS66]WPC39288.1 YARHG domain-containing protein [Clostridium sp. JS66]
MSKCRKCGYELSSKDKFCPSCGTKHKIEEDNINRKIEDNIIKDTIGNEDNSDENTIVEKGEYVEFIEHKEKINYDDNTTINMKSNTHEFDKVEDESEPGIDNLKSRGIKLKALAAAIVLVFFVGFGITYMHLNKGKNNNSSVSNSSNKQTTYNNEKTSTKQNTEKDSKIQTEEKDENSNEYILPYSNKRPITKNDLKGLSKKQLQLARNEIFARHGYVFGEPFKNYFKSKSWYKEDKNFTGEGKQLSALERHNIKVIAKQEGGKVVPGYDSDYKESDYAN